MALVLCTGVDRLLIQTRKLILQNAGHKVIGVVGELELLAACQEHNFDVAVIGQVITQNEKHRIMILVRANCPTAKVLELYSPDTGRCLPDADEWLEVPAMIPSDLPEAVTSLASGASA